MILQQDAVQPLVQVAPILFFALAALMAVSAWAVVFSHNIVRMAVYLLFTLGGSAGLYFMLNAEFLAAVQLIVYVGGTLILIIFGIMLTSKNPFMQLKIKSWEKMVAVFLAIVIAGILIFATVNTDLGSSPLTAADEGYNQVEHIGKSLLTTYLAPFEISAVLLLVVMIGAAYMARRRPRNLDP